MDFAPKDIPGHDAPEESFVFPDQDEREAAVAWAAGLIADHIHYGPAQIIRAARVLLANSPSHHKVATWLLDITPKPEVSHAA